MKKGLSYGKKKKIYRTILGILVLFPFNTYKIIQSNHYWQLVVLKYINE